MSSYVAQELTGIIRNCEGGTYQVLVENIPFEALLPVPHNPSFDRSLNEGEKLECIVMSEARIGHLVPREIVGVLVKERNKRKLYYDGIAGREAEYLSEYDHSPADVALHLMERDEFRVA